MKSKIDKQKHTKAGRKILAGLEEIVDALESGKRLTGRIYSGPVKVAEPGQYSPSDIFAIRQKLHVSQAVFAELLGISTVLAQSWEQGRRIPHATARRLLDEINRDPSRWARMVRKSAA
jgi:putative transcriptional regulator